MRPDGLQDKSIRQRTREMAQHVKAPSVTLDGPYLVPRTFIVKERTEFSDFRMHKQRLIAWLLGCADRQTAA